MQTSIAIHAVFSLRDCIRLVRDFLSLLTREKRAIIKLQHNRVEYYTTQKKIFLEQLSKIELHALLLANKNASEKILLKQLLTELKQSLHINHELLLFALTCVQSKQPSKNTHDKGICGYNHLAEPTINRNNVVITRV